MPPHLTRNEKQGDFRERQKDLCYGDRMAVSATLAQGCSSMDALKQARSSEMSDMVFTADERGDSISVVNLQTRTVETTPIPVSPHNV